MPGKSHRTRKNKSRRTRKTRHTKKHRGHKRSRHQRSRHQRSRHSGHKRHHIHSEYMMHGGHAPAFLVGSPYNAGDLNPKGNYLPLSNNGVPSGLPNPPMPSNPQFGGKKGGCMDWFKKKSKRKGRKGRKGMRQRGGGLSDFMTAIVPDDLMNIGRSIPAAAGNFMDKFNGLRPLGTSQVYPTQQPLIQQGQQAATTVRPPDITGAYSRAVGSVQNI